MKKNPVATVVQCTGLLADNPQMRAFASSIDYGIIVANKDGCIVDFNQAALDIFGYKEEELRGQAVTLIMPPRFREAHDSGMSRYNRTKKPQNLGKTLRLFGLTKDGKEIPIEIALSAWTDTDQTQYFTASIRRYSKLENNLGTIMLSAFIMTAIMLITLVVIGVRSF